MNSPLTRKQRDFGIYTAFNHPINLVRKHELSLKSYNVNVLREIVTNKLIVVASSNGEFLSPTNWTTDDVFLFRFYLEDEYKKLPIYAEINDDKEEYIFVAN